MSELSAGYQKALENAEDKIAALEAERDEVEANNHVVGSLDNNILLDRAAALITVARCLNFDFDEDAMKSTPADDNHKSMAIARARMRDESIAAKAA